MFTFSYRYLNPMFTREWTVSGKRFDTFLAAGNAAISWAEACDANDAPIELRIIRISTATT